MDLAGAARSLNDIGYSYISSWALLTAAGERVFDRLPATAEDLTDTYPDADLTTTWFNVLERYGVIERTGSEWSLPEEMRILLTGDDSYADYLGVQILTQLVPRLTLGTDGHNVLASVLRDPGSRRGYEGWFEDAAEADAYQRSQYAGSLLPARAISKGIPTPEGRVFDLGGGWGAVARAIAERHQVDVDVVDLDPVVASAPPAGERVNFRAGSALDPSTWPTGQGYDGAVLSYLFSSVPGDTHGPVLDGLAALDDSSIRWVAVHDFFTDSGRFSPSWCLQHAVFVPGHRSRTTGDIEAMLAARGWTEVTVQPLVDEMTSLVIGTRS